MRGVNHDRQLDFLGELDLRAQIFVLQRGLLVIAELADRNDALLGGEVRQDLHTASASASLFASFGLSPTQQ